MNQEPPGNLQSVIINNHDDWPPTVTAFQFRLGFGGSGSPFSTVFVSLTLITNQSMGSVEKVPAWSFGPAQVRFRNWWFCTSRSLDPMALIPTRQSLGRDRERFIGGEHGGCEPCGSRRKHVGRFSYFSVWKNATFFSIDTLDLWGKLTHRCGKPTVFLTNMIFKWWSCHIGMLVCHRIFDDRRA